MTTFADAGAPRALESEEGARLLGAECVLLEARLLKDSHGLPGRLEQILESMKSDTIITHWGGDSHPDHVLVQRAVVAAVTKMRITHGRPSAVFSCDTYYSQGLHGMFMPAYYIDISDVLDQKLAALSAHRTQSPAKWTAMARDMAACHGGRCGCKYAEGFDELPILGQRLRLELLPGGNT